MFLILKLRFSKIACVVERCSRCSFVTLLKLAAFFPKKLDPQPALKFQPSSLALFTAILCSCQSFKRAGFRFFLFFTFDRRILSVHFFFSLLCLIQHVHIFTAGNPVRNTTFGKINFEHFLFRLNLSPSPAVGGDSKTRSRARRKRKHEREVQVSQVEVKTKSRKQVRS